MVTVQLRVSMVAVAAATVGLAGCAELEQQMPIIALLDKGPQPPKMVIQQERIPDVPRYRVTKSCTYNAQYGLQRSIVSVSIQPVRDRLLVTIDNNVGGRSTMLISGTGRRYSFNAYNPNGSQISSDRWAGQTSADGQPIMNNMDLIAPSYISGGKDVGDVVALVTDSNGKVSAGFVYVGSGSVRGHQILSLRFVVNPTSMRPGLDHSIGYSLIDRSTGLPLSLSLGRNPNIKLELSSCS